jgi:D-tyrosyl-tRNA(Tyr) deacylase
MRALVQRVTRGAVSVDGEVIGAIGAGLVILVGVGQNDDENDARNLAEKCVNLRIFADEAGKFNRSLLDVNGEILAVSQFTLYGDASKGRRPSFVQAAPAEISRALYDAFVAALRTFKVRVAEGRFGAMMMVEIHNDGPVTLMVESR